MEKIIEIQNLKCGGCANTIQTKLSGINGITVISINVNESKIHFSYTELEQVAIVQQKLKVIGYPVLGEDNNITSKAKSYVSCAIGKINK